MQAAINKLSGGRGQKSVQGIDQAVAEQVHGIGQAVAEQEQLLVRPDGQKSSIPSRLSPGHHTDHVAFTFASSASREDSPIHRPSALSTSGGTRLGAKEKTNVSSDARRI